MASDEFISLDATGEADAEGEEGGDLQVEAPDVNGAEPQQASELQPEGEAGTVGNNPKPSDGNIDLEEGELEDMDIADDDVVVVKDELLDASVQPEVSVAAVQTVIGFEVKLDKGIGAENAPNYVSNSISVEESPARGVKRARVESKEPSVRVIYSDLTRESKRKLMELMQHWSQWQARRQHKVKVLFHTIMHVSFSLLGGPKFIT